VCAAGPCPIAFDLEVACDADIDETFSLALSTDETYLAFYSGNSDYDEAAKLFAIDAHGGADLGLSSLVERGQNNLSLAVDPTTGSPALMVGSRLVTMGANGLAVETLELPKKDVPLAFAIGPDGRQYITNHFTSWGWRLPGEPWALVARPYAWPAGVTVGADGEPVPWWDEYGFVADFPSGNVTLAVKDGSTPPSVAGPPMATLDPSEPLVVALTQGDGEDVPMILYRSSGPGTTERTHVPGANSLHFTCTSDGQAFTKAECNATPDCHETGAGSLGIFATDRTQDGAVWLAYVYTQLDVQIGYYWDHTVSRRPTASESRSRTRRRSSCGSSASPAGPSSRCSPCRWSSRSGCRCGPMGRM
jgi:hypothetical protein